MQNAHLVLASTSKIRASILTGAGLDFRVTAPMLDESVAKAQLAGFLPPALALELAKQKALSVTSKSDHILGADQTLSCEGQLYNKPNSLTEAYEHLMSLRGRTHHLHSALAIAHQGEVIWSTCDTAELTMREFSAEYATNYLNTSGEELLHTVGAYQLESRGAQLFDKIQGDYFTILGLPLLPLLAFLRHIKFIDS